MRNKDLEERLKEIKAFYEGDIIEIDKIEMDKSHSKSKKEVKWHDWDMVMVIPNPDFHNGNGNSNEHYIDGVVEAKEIYMN